MKTLSTFVASAMLFTTAQADAQPKEPYFGRYATVCAVPDVTPSAGGTGPVRSSPVHPDTDKLIRDFIVNAGEEQARLQFLDRTNLPDKTVESCSHAIAKLSEANCKLLPLYLLGDDEIRAEWLCEGKSAYMAFFTVANGKISNIWAIGDLPPVVVAAPTRS